MAMISGMIRLVRTKRPTALIRAVVSALYENVQRDRLVIEQKRNGDWECHLQKTWRLPRWLRFKELVNTRLGTPAADFRRRAETAPPMADEGMSSSPAIRHVLLAGPSALADERVKRFLCRLAADGRLNLLHDRLPRSWPKEATNLLYGIEADAIGQALLLELRKSGIGCDWLSATVDTSATETPMREACDRQAIPSEDGKRLRYAYIKRPDKLFPKISVAGSAPQQLRILTYRWHVPHQYELFKLGAEFTLITDLGEGSCRWWDLGQRPLPANVRFAHWAEIDPRQFDLAVLHFDENVLQAAADARSVGAEWGATFRFLQQNLAIPRVAVCHGTPQANAPAQRAALARFLGDTPVVVNSHQAQSEWGFANARVIWQGFDPAEFPCRPPPNRRAPRILTLPEEAMAERPGYRGADLLAQVASRVAPPLERLCVAEPNLLLRGNAYADARFAHYVAALHGFDIYFNPTLRSPMPRSRGEAMLCGLATVNADSHDVDRFIENGLNGFYAATAEELADQLNFLLADPARAWRIGQAGRETAMQRFHIDRYLADWRQLIRDTLGSNAI